MHGGALKLDFDFKKTAGYAYVRRELPLDLPENFELTFNLRASAPVNNLEVKLTDASGDNVWWFDRRDFEFPRDWQRIRIKKRQISFAWGPIKDKSLRHTDKIEFVVSAGRGGGNGSIEIDDLQLRELPPRPRSSRSFRRRQAHHSAAPSPALRSMAICAPPGAPIPRAEPSSASPSISACSASSAGSS